MNPSMAPLIEIYRVNNMLLPNAVKDVKEEHFGVKPNDKANSLLWVVGHLASSRFMVMSMAGHDEKCPWGELFGGEIQPGDVESYPAMSEITDTWNKISKTLLNTLSNVSDEVLKGEPPFDFPVEDKTNLGGIAFMALHESYHVGQLAYIRRLLGYAQLVG